MIFETNFNNKWIENIKYSLIEFFTLDKVIFIGALIVLTILTINIISIILGYNILKPDNFFIQNKREEFKNNIKKNLLYYYKKIIIYISNYLKKYNIISRYKKEKFDIVLERLGIKFIKNENDILTTYQYYSINILYSSILLLLSIFLIIILDKKFYAIIIGISLIILFYINIIRKKMYENLVKKTDIIFNEEFESFYLTQHDVLLNNTKNPFSTGLKLYQIKCNNPFMQAWIKYTLDQIEIYSEAVIIDKYLIIYSSNNYLYKLLSIQKQILNGSIERAKIAMEGIRSQIIEDIELKAKRKANFITNIVTILTYLVLIVLIQAAIGIIIWVLVYSNKI